MTHALTTRADSSKPYGAVSYADPGYQSDKKARYPVDTAEHAKAAWSYINQASSADQYSAADLTKVRDRIKAACEKFGIDVSDDEPASRYNDFHNGTGVGGGQFSSGPSGGGKTPAKKPAGKKPTHKGHGPTHHMPSGGSTGTLAYDPSKKHGTGYGYANGDAKVHELQQTLSRLGIKDSAGHGLKDDGQLGPKTTAAVKKLQRELGLPANGQVTQEFLARIKAMKSLPKSAPKKRGAGMLAVCVRSFEFESRAAGGDGRTLEGYAAIFNSPTRIRDMQGDFDEHIRPGAFKRSLAERMPVLQFDHGKDPRIGTAPIGSIETLSEDTQGLHVRARLFDHPDIDRVRLAIQGKAIRGMSFRFGVPDGGDTWSRDGDMDVREIRDADVHELGPVVFPAYDSTSVSVRSLLAQLDPEGHRALLRELAAELRDLDVEDIEDFTGRPGTRGAGGGEPGTEPGNGDGPPEDIRQRVADGDELRLRGILR